MASLNGCKSGRLTFPRTARVMVLAFLVWVIWSFYHPRLYQNMYESFRISKIHFQWDSGIAYREHNRLFEEYNYLTVQKLRLQHLQEECTDHSLVSERTYQRILSTRHYYSKAYNFSYCKVPKIGSTFWTQVFLILDNLPVDRMLQMPRLAIHSKKTLTPSARRQSESSRVLLVTRDPYSRLYSGYVDKLYIGNKSSLRKYIGQMNNLTNCNTFNISFEQFLTYVVRKAKSNKVLDSHWAPIVSLCSPCEVKPFRVIKQETFSKDVGAVLKEINIEPSKYRIIADVLHDHRAEATIPGIVETLYQKVRKQNDVLRCIGLSGVARRLWTSFQIQGFIDAHIEFPNHAFENEDDFANYTKLSNIILGTVKRIPLSSEARRAQRNSALVSAFQKVNKETIDGIRDVYRPDFQLFDYDDKSPSVNKFRES